MESEKLAAVRGYIAARADFIKSTLERLVRIPSVRAEPVTDAPFGKDCADALRETAAIYRENGFSVNERLSDGYITAEFRAGDASKNVGVFAHADVVPAGDGWTLTEPFSPRVIDGCLVGRGSGDNKSGVVASLIAAMAVRDLGLSPDVKLTLFTGSCEESGMADVKAFAENELMPDVSLVPDTCFPVFRGEKGIINLRATCRRAFDTIVEFTDKNAFKFVPGTAVATFKRALNRAAAGGSESTLSNVRSELTLSEDGRTLTAKGIAKHPAMPRGSKNAVELLARALSECSEISGNDRSILADMLPFFDIFGEGIGAAGVDPDFGELTSASGMVGLDGGKPVLWFNIRYGASLDGAEIVRKVTEKLGEKGFDVQVESMSGGFIVPESDPTLKALLEAYSEATGSVSPKACLSDGGTYARYLKNAFSTGSYTWRERPSGLPEGHGGAHSPDEYVSLAGIADAAAILACMIARLSEH